MLTFLLFSWQTHFQCSTIVILTPITLTLLLGVSKQIANELDGKRARRYDSKVSWGKKIIMRYKLSYNKQSKTKTAEATFA